MKEFVNVRALCGITSKVNSIVILWVRLPFVNIVVGAGIDMHSSGVRNGTWTVVECLPVTSLSMTCEMDAKKSNLTPAFERVE